jgi:hypothetical protein
MINHLPWHRLESLCHHWQEIFETLVILGFSKARLRLLNPRDYLDFEPHLTVAAAGDAHVQAADLVHEMKLVGVQAFAQALVDQGHRHRQLRDGINTQPGRTELGDEITVHVQDKLIARLVAGLQFRALITSTAMG